ncbi:AAA domain-containing protein [Rhodococcus triatomae]|uniref:AAA domain-containing protein n=1 Tax=Rhodococcus triatomae TaxID=300028 RepID=A0A1G8SNB2_9NOCA|nr:AAA domain-containing protein [Rhodococcus triatomae]SDJ30664.1 AAA domain-containing protein [Rhodococcus triatomae]
MEGTSTQRVAPATGAATWQWIKGETLDAVDDLIEQSLAKVVLTTATRKPVRFSPHWRKLTVDVSGQRPAGGWERARWFLVDADTAGSSDPQRANVTIIEKPKPWKLVFDIMGASEALGSVTAVHAAYSDDMELQLLLQLREALIACTRAPQLENMWKPDPVLSPRSEPVGLNPPQAQAFSAMTQPGGALVWGPPGTGKTKVIVAAVSDALAHGRSVLIASHTHVAVDNVVADVAKTVKGPGQIVRVGSADKIGSEVAAHDWLTLDKAAAALTNRDQRMKAIDDAAAALRDAPARSALESVLDQIGDLGFDVDAAVQLRDLQQHRQQLSGEAETLATDRTDLLTRHGQILAELAELGDVDRNLADAAARAHAARNTAEQAYHSFHQLQQATFTIDAALAQATAVRVAAANTPRTRIFSRRKASRQSVEHAQANEAELLSQKHTIAARLPHAHHAMEETQRALRAAQAAHFATHEAARRASDLRNHAQSLHTAIRRGDVAAATITTDLAEVDHAISEVTTEHDDDLLSKATENEVFELVMRRDHLAAEVIDLDRRADDLDAERARLRDEFANTRRQLLETAPVLACTLAGLTTASELVRRRFDVVIIDEAASAGIPHLTYAGAKADTTLVYVGDFLQNEPISNVDDAITADDLRRRRWQTGDIFGLHGITSRSTAESHPRCVALRTQYRYPPVIAGIVNQFCYDGLLESHWTATPSPPHVIFLDTAGHPGEGLRRVGSSWKHPLGLELLRAVHDKHGGDGAAIGLVCPYREHALAAQKLARDERLGVDAGTSHKFQGRQFQVVVFDLMQDSARDRWIVGADLAGAQRNVSAAKLLNVGITRAQRTLYLIGDWDYICAAPAPGMRAVRDLESHPHFQRIAATEFVKLG